ncbi:hypothetical protein AZF00_03170 [Zhongshania aliphaticivorans]|uniref:Uncharacterized protein n=1 Tax=Zhongshania aliphaticivorans TaxID=1470434 RepID=A0A127M2A2_9GAMM|nr:MULTISPECIES: hypothetical protein [Spongiibacteraceae]AMO67363.1 hypothetical protein AZF00_03170 [Zhongshania aliphaticivorans]
MKVNFQTFLSRSIWAQHDFIDQAANDLCGLCALVILVQNSHQFFDLLAVAFAHIGVDVNRLFYCGFKQAFQFLIAVFQLPHAVLHTGGRYAIADRVDQLVELLVIAIKLFFVGFDGRIAPHAKLVHMAGIFFREHRCQFRVHQMMAKPVQYGIFEEVATDGTAVRAGSLVARRRTTKMLAGDFGESSAAFPALH